MKNMGSTDRSVRIVAAVIIGVLYLAGVLSGATALVLGIFAIIFLITSFVSFCPLYVPFRINTIKKGKK